MMTQSGKTRVRNRPRLPIKPLDGYKIRQAARLIARWSSPKAFEPAHGFLLRIAALHREGNALDFARSVGIENNNDPVRCLEILISSAMAQAADIEALRIATPVFHGEETRRKKRTKIETHFAFTTLCGQTLRRADWTAATRRFCSGCLAESPHHRAWFDLRIVHTCPFHGVALTDRAPDGSTVRWLRSSIASNGDGLSLACTISRVEGIEDSLENYALGRMGVITPFTKALLDGYPLYQVIEAAEMMGRLKLGGWRAKMPLVGRLGLPERELQVAGYSVLTGGVEFVEQFFREIAESAPEATFGAKSLFGWAVDRFSMKEDLSIELRRLMIGVGKKLGRTGRVYNKDGWSLGERLTMREVARQIGQKESTVTALCRALDLLLPHVSRSGNPLLVLAENVELLRDKIFESVTRTEAAAILRVNADIFADLVRARHVQKIGSRWGEDGLEDRFERKEIERFLASIPTTVSYVPGLDKDFSHILKSLPEALEQTACDVGTFFDDVFSGELVIHLNNKCGRGLDDFKVLPRALPMGNPFTKRLLSSIKTRVNRCELGGITQKEAAALLDTQEATVKILTDLGYLSIMGPLKFSNRQKLDRASVQAFADKYAASRLYAPIMGCGLTAVPKFLAKMGVSHILSDDPRVPQDGPKVTRFYDRAQLRRVLGLATDPDVATFGRRFWKHVASHLGRNKSTFMLWLGYSETEALFSTTGREWPVSVQYRFETNPSAPKFGGFLPYTIVATLEIKGHNSRARINKLVALAGDREILSDIRLDVDPHLGTFSATLEAHVFCADLEGDPMRSVCEHADEDARLIERMLFILKGAFEEGERPYDARVFGTWPSGFIRTPPLKGEIIDLGELGPATA